MLQLEQSFRFRHGGDDDAVNNKTRKKQSFRFSRHHINRCRQVGGIIRTPKKFLKKKRVYRLDDYMTSLILNKQWNGSIFISKNNGENQYEIQQPEYCNNNEFKLIVCQDDNTNILSVRSSIYTCKSDQVQSTSVMEKALELNYFGGDCNKSYTIAMNPLSSFPPLEEKQTPYINLTLCLSLPMAKLGSSSKDNNFCELMNDFLELAFDVKNQLNDAAETSLLASPPEIVTELSGKTNDNIEPKLPPPTTTLTCKLLPPNPLSQPVTMNHLRGRNSSISASTSAVSASGEQFKKSFIKTRSFPSPPIQFSSPEEAKAFALYKQKRSKLKRMNRSSSNRKIRKEMSVAATKAIAGKNNNHTPTSGTKNNDTQTISNPLSPPPLPQWQPQRLISFPDGGKFHFPLPQKECGTMNSKNGKTPVISNKRIVADAKKDKCDAAMATTTATTMKPSSTTRYPPTTVSVLKNTQRGDKNNINDAVHKKKGKLFRSMNSMTKTIANGGFTIHDEDDYYLQYPRKAISECKYIG